MVLNAYKTKRGNVLKVYQTEDVTDATRKLYNFTLHIPKAHGESIRVLQIGIPLHNPKYLTQLYIDKY